MRFGCGEPVDRHARKGLAMTKLELGNDQRFIPLHLFHSSPFNLHSSIYWFTVDRHGLSALAMTRLCKNGVDLRSLEWLLWHCTGMRTDPSGYPAGIF
jgi:hypothetical protein